MYVKIDCRTYFVIKHMCARIGSSGRLFPASFRDTHYVHKLRYHSVVQLRERLNNCASHSYGYFLFSNKNYTIKIRCARMAVTQQIGRMSLCNSRKHYHIDANLTDDSSFT